MSDPIQEQPRGDDTHQRLVGPSSISEDDINQAHEIVFAAGHASTSVLQRRLRIGFWRASDLLEEMERLGIVGPFSPYEAREVLRRPNKEPHRQEPAAGSQYGGGDGSATNGGET